MSERRNETLQLGRDELPQVIEGIDEERLADAIVTAFRAVAKQHWPWLRGDGWPAYDESHGGKVITQVLLVNEIAAAVAAEYRAPAARTTHE